MCEPITLAIAGGSLIAGSVGAVAAVAQYGHTKIQDHKKPKPPKNDLQQPPQQVQYFYAPSPGCPTPGSYSQSPAQPQGYFQQPVGPYNQPPPGTPYACSPYGYQSGMVSPPIAQPQMMPQYQYMQPQAVNSPPPSYAYAIAQEPEKKHRKWYKP